MNAAGLIESTFRRTGCFPRPRSIEEPTSRKNPCVPAISPEPAEGEREAARPVTERGDREVRPGSWRRRPRRSWPWRSRPPGAGSPACMNITRHGGDDHPHRVDPAVRVAHASLEVLDRLRPDRTPSPARPARQMSCERDRRSQVPSFHLFNTTSGRHPGSHPKLGAGRPPVVIPVSKLAARGLVPPVVGAVSRRLRPVPRWRPRVRGPQCAISSPGGIAALALHSSRARGVELVEELVGVQRVVMEEQHPVGADPVREGDRVARLPNAPSRRDPGTPRRCTGSRGSEGRRRGRGRSPRSSRLEPASGAPSAGSWSGM